MPSVLQVWSENCAVVVGVMYLGVWSYATVAVDFILGWHVDFRCARVGNVEAMRQGVVSLPCGLPRCCTVAGDMLHVPNFAGAWGSIVVCV